MRALSMLALAVGLCGCAGASPPPPTDAAAPPPAATSQALRVAADLAAAAQAEVDADAPALTAAVTRLRNRGVQPQGPEAEASLAQWSAAAGVDPAPLRGRALGPGFQRGTLAPGEERGIEQLFFAGKPAEIALSGDTGSRLRLTLLDAKNRVVCEHDPGLGRSCRFTPLFSQRYAIEIANGGQKRATYFLVID
ncbi:hypothetical protein [Erythrobacter donghaensis]|uniref:hypothetical protein n=1 Tax=Erythrobacter donghaensis TaxID=267135 RepID=UPI001302B108|nr:hypothetical protein [Erythrobacter donghaensis]